jgi:hypothetical protein
MLSRIPLITGLVASLALFAQAPAQASNRDAAIAGAVVGAVIGGVLVSQSRPARVYAPPLREYYPPPPAYYPPQRVYYERQPVYYQPAPVYYIQERPRHKRWHGHKHRRHDSYGHGYRW